jgi:hypothetical protein
MGPSALFHLEIFTSPFLLHLPTTSNLSNLGRLDIWALEARETDRKKTRKKTEKPYAKALSDSRITRLVKRSYFILPGHVAFVVCGCFEFYRTFEGNVLRSTVSE